MSTSGWRQILKNIDPTGVVDGFGNVEFGFKRRDPALGDQLAKRAEALGSLDPQGRYQAYLDACGKAPLASEGTKAKWRRRLNLA
jgi:hypothetical protein